MATTARGGRASVSDNRQQHCKRLHVRWRWFVLKHGKLFWFKDSVVTRTSVPHVIIPVVSCLTIKGAEDALNRPYAYELFNGVDTMYFIADSEKAKEEWINSIDPSSSTLTASLTPRSSTTTTPTAPPPDPPSPNPPAMNRGPDRTSDIFAFYAQISSQSLDRDSMTEI